MTHTLLVCSGKRRVAPEVLRHPLVQTLSVVTETGHPDIYGGAAVETVASIEDYGSVLAAALRLNRDRPIDNVMTPYETGLPAGAFVRTILGLPGIDFHTATGFTDKYAMKRRISAAGIDVAPHLLAQDRPHAIEAANRLGFPVVVKPLYGGGSMGVTVCEDAAEIGQWWDRFAAGKQRPAALVEKRADIIAEYHLDSVVLNGWDRFSVVSRYIEPMLETARTRDPYASYQLPDDHPDSRTITALHERVVAALGLDSAVTHMEVFKTESGWVTSEIACRAAGGAIPEAVAMRHGPDLFDTAIGLSLGETPDLTERPAYEYAYFGHVALGVRPGTVTDISTDETFADVPGVVATDIRAKTGDLMPEAFYSATASGFVYAGADSEAMIARTIAEIRRRHVIETTL